MKKKIISRISSLLVLIILSQSVTAQATRTWVSGVGDDVNPCSRTAPCKTLAGAISKTAAGGEINVIDGGGYGAVTITKSITIDGGGSMASILSSGTNGIIINNSDAVVTIRRFSINGAGSGISGIKIVSAKKVQVEDCYLGNFTQKGIELNGTDATMLLLNNVTIHNAVDAVLLNDPAASASIDKCKFQSLSGNGLNITGGQVMLNNSNIADCNIAVMAGTGSSIHLSNNVISNNTTALKGDGKISSSGNNTITLNKTNGVAATMIKPQ